MKVAFDGRRMQDRPLGGVGRALTHLLPCLTTEAEIVVLTDARRPPPDISEALLQPLRVPRRAPEASWLHIAVASWLRRWDGVFHGTFNQVPIFCPVPSVDTIHDLSFEHHPEDFGVAKRRWFQFQARVAARRAQRITTPSEVVRQELIQTYQLPPGRVIVAPNTADPVFHPRTEDGIESVKRAHGVRGRYVIALGGARRRGLRVAVEAWEASGAREMGVGLVAVGPEAPPELEGVTWVGLVSDTEWATLLAGAELFCYPTRLEGFGMPALEAAASGTPVVCARIPALEEVLGPAAAWCERPTVSDMAPVLKEFLEQPAERADLSTLSLQRAAAAPGLKDAAGATLRAYREALEG
jgi:glycosyltransferase involved in cell wall biosynthesis